VSHAQLEDLGLMVAPTSPATDFIRQRLQGVSPDDPQIDSKSYHAIIDLVASDVPLDPRTRSLLAGDLRSLYFPDAERDRSVKRRAEIAMIESLKHLLLRRGMLTKEAEHAIIQTIGKALGITSVATLRKRIQRACRTKI
jgi:hypothetical protein